MNGDELRTARLTADLTQQELADKLSVSMRTVGNWERASTRLPKSRARQIRDILGGVGDDANPLEAASDMALLAELGRRLDRGAQTKEAETYVEPAAAGEKIPGVDRIDLQRKFTTPGRGRKPLPRVADREPARDVLE